MARKAEPHSFDFGDFCLLVGFCAFVYGAWLFAPWAGFSLGGLSLIAYGVVRAG